MKIIQEKHNHLERYAIWTCKNCGSIIKSRIDEGQYVNQTRGAEEHYILNVCPVCETKNSVITSNYKTEEERPSGNYYDR